MGGIHLERKESVFMRVPKVEHLVQDYVGRFAVPAGSLSSWKQMVGERGFEPPTPGPEPDSVIY